jgi:hypothetical protein
MTLDVVFSDITRIFFLGDFNNLYLQKIHEYISHLDEHDVTVNLKMIEKFFLFTNLKPVIADEQTCHNHINIHSKSKYQMEYFEFPVLRLYHVVLHPVLELLRASWCFLMTIISMNKS